MKPADTAVLGCGIIGSSWIAAFAAAGHAVQAWDPDPDALRAVKSKYGAAVAIFDTPVTPSDRS
jgi:3-hydroxyacyl-CoA dehydrogenase